MWIQQRFGFNGGGNTLGCHGLISFGSHSEKIILARVARMTKDKLRALELVNPAISRSPGPHHIEAKAFAGQIVRHPRLGHRKGKYSRARKWPLSRHEGNALCVERETFQFNQTFATTYGGDCLVDNLGNGQIPCRRRVR